MAFAAVSFCLLSSCMPSIALSPKGVAALSRPSMFALKFMKMCPNTGCPAGISGKSRTMRGDSQRAITLTRPLRSPIFMIPIQSESTPVSPSEISKAVLALSNVLFMMAGKTSVLPSISCTVAIRKAMAKKPTQM